MVYEERQVAQPVAAQPVAYQEAAPQRTSWTGYAAVKYGATVIIVLAILAFLAWYVIPKF